MKRFLIILFLFISLIASATDYYVKTAGSDANTGLSDGQAWQTITKVNSMWLGFIGGDKVFFNRGDTFYGTLTAGSSGSIGNPIMIGAYGTGLAPVISAFTTLSSWTNEGGGIYSKVVSTSNPNVLIIDGINTSLGRYPDSGWLTVDSHSGTSSITDAALPSAPDWDGAEVVIRKRAWIIDRNYITSHAGTTISYTTASGYEPVNGTGYFVQNDLSACTALGEWLYTGGKVYMYFGAVNPATKTVKISTLAQNISIQGRNNITITGLSLEGANESAVYISSSDNITIQECRIQFCGDAAIDGGHNGGNSSLGLRVINDTIKDVQNHGILLQTEFDGALIQGCVFNNIGMLPGMTFSGDGHNMGMRVEGSNHVIEYNRLTNLGYNGIEFEGSNVKCRNNYINNFALIKDDVGGIYTMSYSTMWSGREIYGNLVLNGIGSAIGSLYGETQGIYCDQRNTNIMIGENTVFNCTNGIFMHNSHECNIYGNTVYSNQNSALNLVHSSYDWPNDPTRNLEIVNNLFVVKHSPAYAYYFESHDGVADNYLFGNADNNLIGWLYDEIVPPTNRPIRLTGNYVGSNYALSQWKYNSGQDVASTGYLGVAITDTADIKFRYNDTRINKTFTMSTDMIDVSNNAYSAGILTLTSFTSIILIGTGTVIDNDDPGGLPSVLPTVQDFITNITNTTATIGGSVTDDGGAAITDRGICWGLTINPNTSGSHTHNGTGLGTFYQEITGLSEGMSYYVRAFATNTVGTAYSANLVFTTTGISSARFVKHLEELVKHSYKFIKAQ